MKTLVVRAPPRDADTDAETGFVYLRSRYYDPATAQFVTVDHAYPQSGSRYGYVNGSPLNGTDPTGMCWPACWQAGADFAGGVLNVVTFGHEEQVTRALHVSDHVNRCSGAYAIGEVAGTVAMVALVPGVAGEAGAGEAVSAETAIPQEDEGIVYRRVDAEGMKDYVGQAKNDTRFLARQAEHAAANPDADFSFEILGRAQPGEQLDRLEEYFIREGGGPTNSGNPEGGLSNLRHQMNPTRYANAGGDF